MIGRKQRNVLKIYSDHLANQEAEISQLESLLGDFRNKLGDIGIKDSVASQKADLEKNIQEKRQENQTLNLSLNTKEEESSQLQSSLKELDSVLNKLSSENSSLELKNFQSEISDLESKHSEIDNIIREKEDQINNLLSTKKS